MEKPIRGPDADFPNDYLEGNVRKNLWMLLCNAMYTFVLHILMQHDLLFHSYTSQAMKHRPQRIVISTAPELMQGGGRDYS